MADPTLKNCTGSPERARDGSMADPRNQEEALELLQALIEADPALRDRPRDEPLLHELLRRRLARAEAEAEEAARRSDGPNRSPDVPGVVREILQDDLVANPTTTPGGRMISECDEIVLAWNEVTPLLLSNYVRRCYAILDAAGRELGEVHQISNPSRGELAAHPLLDHSDLQFQVLDRTVGQTFVFRRAGAQLYILDEVGTQLGFVHFKPGEALPSYKVVSSLDRGMIQLRTDCDRPYRLRVFGNIGDEIGTIQRRFVGPSPYLDETNRMRIRVEPGRVSPGQRWGLVAVAVLAGIDDEEACDRA